MASVLVPCCVCNLGVRFDTGQPIPELVVCENYICRAEVARQERVNAPAPVEDAPGKSGDAPHGKGKGKGPK